MNIYLVLLLFSFIILLYWVITELFTFFFRLTGLPAEKARFQVISLLTGTGFYHEGERDYSVLPAAPPACADYHAFRICIQCDHRFRVHQRVFIHEGYPGRA